MCTSVSTLCKQTCDAIVEQNPILTAISQQLDDQRQQLDLQCQQLEEQRQQTELLRQQNQILQQQVTRLTRAFHNSIPDEIDDDFFLKDNTHEVSSQWFDYNVEYRAVEESKEVNNLEEQSSSASSSLSGDTVIAPCAAASTTTCIRRTDREAPRVKDATQTTPAKAEHNIVKVRVVYKPPQQTDAEMSEHYNKRSASPPTTNSITAIVIPKKSKKVRTKSGKANNKAAQRRL